MRPVLVLVALAAAAPALGASDDAARVKAAFGNTIVLTYPDGRKGETWLMADGTYTGEGRRKDPSSGHWRVKGGRMCLKQSKPRAIPFSYCVKLPEGGLGDGFEARAPTGEKVKITLVQGHVVP